MWVVKLVKPIPPIDNPYPDGYFPRKFRYKRDAVALAEEVKSTGGIAKVEKVQNSNKEE